MTFTQEKVGQFHSEKEAKSCGSPHKIRVMYEIKGNIWRFIVNERALCDSNTKVSGTVPLEKRSTCAAVHTWK